MPQYMICINLILISGIALDTAEALATAGLHRIASLAATAEVKGMEKVLKAIEGMKTALKKELQQKISMLCGTHLNS